MNRLSNISATTAARFAATLAAVTLLALPGCNRRSSLTGTGDAGDAATAGDDATASDTATSGTEPGTSDTDATTASDDGDTSMDDGGDSTGDDCEGFLGCPDGAPFPEACTQYGLFDLERGASPAFGACDFWAQDCDDGQKCLDVQCSNGTYDGFGAWCVPVGSAPLNAPCTLVVDGRDGGYGEDTCGADGICLEAAVFSQSTCVELCTGTPALPSCPATANEGKRCVQLRGGSLNICVAECSPLQGDDCPDGWSCMPATEGEVLTTMMCYPNPSPGSGPGGGPGDGPVGAGAPCGGAAGGANVCGPGLMCAPGDLYGGAGCPDDPAQPCCTPYCDLVDPGGACPVNGQQCQPLFDPATHPQYATLGACLETAPVDGVLGGLVY